MLKSFLYAFQGIAAALKSERNLRFHLLATTCVVAFGFLVDLEKSEWLLVVLAICGVWSAELFNTAIEKLVDIVHPEQDIRVKFIKDVAAAAVLIVSIAAIAVAVYVFGDKVFNLL